jgi:DnaJ-class molecular chaperone
MTKTPNTDTCEACCGTGQSNSMHSPYPVRKILYAECTLCKGTGKKPNAG